MSSEPVVSEQRSFRIIISTFTTREYLYNFISHLFCLILGKKFPVKYAAVGIAVASLFMMGLADVLVVYIKYCHHLYNRISGAV